MLPIHEKPIQAKGLFACRMIGCKENLPICRLLNHIRYFHKDQLIEVDKDEAVPMPTQENYEYSGSWTFQCRNSFRRAIFIHNYGLFFLIVNFEKQLNDMSIKAWVQCACPNDNARHFRFTLQLLYGPSLASYRDFVRNSLK